MSPTWPSVERRGAADVGLHDGTVLIAALERLDIEVTLIGRRGELAFANEKARKALNLSGVWEGNTAFASLWEEDTAETKARLRQIAGSSTWLPFTLTRRGADEDDARVALRGRALHCAAQNGAPAFFIIVQKDASRWHAFAQHQGLIRKLNRELANGLRVEATLKRLYDTQRSLNREVVHRVKNNLALLAGMVRIARRTKAKDPTHDPLEEFERRLTSIASVHEVLDRTQETERVRVDEMIRAICEALSRSLVPPNVKIVLELDETILHIDQATPLSLIVNELATNALKHAFPDERQGAVHIALRLDGGRVVLSVADNGAGVMGDAGPQLGSGSGSTIVRQLAMQLDADVQTSLAGGTKWSLAFVPTPTETLPCPLAPHADNDRDGLAAADAVLADKAVREARAVAEASSN